MQINPKARWVARRSQQTEGVHYAETLSPMAKLTLIRVLLALIAQFNLVLHQMDVVTAFLRGDLDEVVYI